MKIQDHKIEIDGLAIYYRTAGDPKNQTLVFINGWAARLSGWLGSDCVINELAKKFYVVCPEMPGLLRSEPPKGIWNFENYANFLNKFLKSLKLYNFILVGQSVGGAIVTTYATFYPNNLKNLVLVDAVQSKRPKNFYFKSRFIFYAIFKKIITSKITPLFFKKLLISSYLGVPWNQIYKKNVQTYAIMGTIQANFKVQVDYKKIKAPLLLVWGDRDTWVTPIQRAKEIQREVSNSKLVIVKGPHTILYRKPKEVIDLIFKNL